MHFIAHPLHFGFAVLWSAEIVDFLVDNQNQSINQPINQSISINQSLV